MNFSILSEPLSESLLITVFVVVMMSLMGLIDFRSDGRLMGFLHRKGSKQGFVAAILGAIPGCMGGYAAVSLYGSGMFSFGSLLAMMIATTGDESFLMLAQFPRTALGIMAGLALLGFVAGIVADGIRGHKDFLAAGMKVRDKRITGSFADSFSAWLKMLWTTMKGEGLHIFLWTFGIMSVLAIAGQYVDLHSLIRDNTALMVLIAVLVGLIPESGPHIIFITMFAQGLLPFSVLIANCISQDGHASLPLIAVSRKSFFVAKLIKALLAFAVAYILLAFGY